MWYCNEEHQFIYKIRQNGVPFFIVYKIPLSLAGNNPASEIQDYIVLAAEKKKVPAMRIPEEKKKLNT